MVSFSSRGLLGRSDADAGFRIGQSAGGFKVFRLADPDDQPTFRAQGGPALPGKSGAPAKGRTQNAKRFDLGNVGVRRVIDRYGQYAPALLHPDLVWPGLDAYACAGGKGQRA